VREESGVDSLLKKAPVRARERAFFDVAIGRFGARRKMARTLPGRSDDSGRPWIPLRRPSRRW